MFQITALYAALLGFVFIGLSARVITYRRSNRISMGDAGDRRLLQLMRTQANCAEYAPMGLILLGLLEMQSAPALLVHLAGLMLLAGRLLHAWGFGAPEPVMPARVAGMALTLTMLGLTSGLLLWFVLF